MRTSQQLYHQIRWDARFCPADYQLGVQLRHDGVEEMPLLEFTPQGDIPWHRILYIRGPQGVVWDRRQGLDILVPPQGDQAEELWKLPFQALTWNVCAGKHGQPLEPRWETLSRMLVPWPAPLVALQEVGPELAARLPPGPYVWHRDELLVALQRPPRWLREIELGPDKNALLFELGHVRVAVVHFTSNFRPGGRARRAEQWQRLRPQLGEGAWLVLGDLNAAEDEVERWTGLDLTPWDPSFLGPRQARYQRILTSPGLGGWAQVLPVEASDHRPLWLELDHPQPKSHSSAWVILAPPQLAERVEPWRRQHDPAWGRWPAHLTLLHPAPEQPDYQAVALQLADTARFRLRLSRLERFSQGLVCWCPDPAHDDPLRRLRHALGGRGPYQPHLTLGKMSLPEGRWEAEFFVDSIAHLKQRDGVFQLERVVSLCPPHPLYGALSGRCGRPPLVVGSSCWGGGGDLDLVTPSQAWPEDARRVDGMWRGPGYDLGGDLRAAHDRDGLMSWLVRQGRWEKFAEEWSRLRHWLDLRGLKGQCWGWPGGLAWATLLARWGWDQFFQKARLPVWTLAEPELNLSEHVPRELGAILQAEWTAPSHQKYEPQGSWLAVDDVPEGEALGLVVDLIRQQGLWVRPIVRASGCLLEWRGGLTPAEMQQRIRRGRQAAERPADSP